MLPKAPTSFPAPPAYLTEQQAAAFLNLSPMTLRTWRARRIGPSCFARFGRAVRYHADELAVWAAARGAGAGTPAATAGGTPQRAR